MSHARCSRDSGSARSSSAFDATIKVQHLIEHAVLLPELKRCGCLYVTSAVEAVDDRILEYLDKNHSAEDFGRAVALLRQAGIAFAPTFVAFTPWTTLEGYADLLHRLIELELVESVPPIQLCVRLLVPEGSHLLTLAGFRNLIQDFDAKTLGYRWQHQDACVDALQQQVQAFVARAEEEGCRAARYSSESGRWLTNPSAGSLRRSTT
jgi:hypothetical protein